MASTFTLTDFVLPTSLVLSGSDVPIAFGMSVTSSDPEQSVVRASVTLDRSIPIDAQRLSYTPPRGYTSYFGGPYTTDHPYLYYTGFSGGADTPQLLGLTQTVSGGQYRGTLPLQANARPGTYNILSLRIEGENSQSQVYSSTDLAALGFGTSFVITDALPPVLTGLTIPGTVNRSANRQIGFYAGAADLNSNIRNVVINLDHPLRTSDGATTSSITLSSGLNTAANATYSLVETIGSGTQSGRYAITSVAVADTAGNTATYSPQQLTAMGFQTGFAISSQFSSDFTGDSRSDVLWQNVNGAVSVWSSISSTGADALQKAIYNASVDPSWHAIDSFDFNGDGLGDVLWRNQNGSIAVWDGYQYGLERSYLHDSVGTSWNVAAAADLNGDGKGDLLWRNDDGSISTWLSDGGAFRENAYFHASVGTSWKVSGAGDFNGDGRQDILWRNDDGAVSVWNSTGSGFQESSFFQAGVSTSWHVSGTGDFDGNGKDDVLWHNDDGRLTVWEGGDFRSVMDAEAATSWHIAQVGDFSGDSKADLLWRNDSGAISIWRSTGSGWAQNTFSDNSVGAGWHIAAHDYTI